MKKYLNKNLFKVHIAFFVAVFGIILFSPNSLAQTKLDYYKNLFRNDFGFLLSERSENVSSNGDYLYSHSDDGYLILLSSDILSSDGLNKYFEKVKRIILICDTPYSALVLDIPYSVGGSLVFTCERSSVYSSQMESVEGFLKTSDSQNIILYVIPENLLVSIDKRDNTKNYLKSTKRSSTVSQIFRDTESIGEEMKPASEATHLTDNIKTLFSTTTFEIFGIAISMFLVVSLSFGLLKYLSSKDLLKYHFSKYKKKFSSSLIEKVLLKTREFLILNRRVVIRTLIIMIIVYISVMFALTLRDTKKLSTDYFITYSLDTLKFTNLVTYINEGHYFRGVVFFYDAIFLILLSTLFIPYSINIVFVASSKIGNTKFKRIIPKYVVPSIIILSIAVSLFSEIYESYRVLIFVVVVIFFIIINNLRYGIFNYKYILREKAIFISIALLVVTAGFLMKIREKEIGPRYTEKDLVGISDPIVMLPYLKVSGENVLFNDFSTSVSEPIFVNQYLVYSPTHARVENKNISEFKNSGSFYIQNGKMENVISAIYVNKELSEVLASNTVSNFFRVKSLEERSGQGGADIQITFSCQNENLKSSTIKSDYYYMFENGEVEKLEKRDLFYFPGCSKVGVPETFTAEFNLLYIGSQDFFMSLNVLDSDIKDIKIITSKGDVEITYYSGIVGYGVLASDVKSDSSRAKITNYIFGNSYDLSFDMTFDMDGKFNISQPINELVKEGKLEKSFLIWSTKKYVPIRLD